MEKLNDKIVRLYDKFRIAKEKLKAEDKTEKKIHAVTDCIDIIKIELDKIENPTLVDVHRIFYKECKGKNK